VEANDLNYAYKYADRTRIDRLLALNEDYDDIIIVQHEMITDSSYANLVFRKNRWLYTPDSALLKGTKRQRYLDEGRIKIMPITVKDLSFYDGFKCINAMLDMDESAWIPIERILT
jgi:4-amino-4-deoxychorismate lyase